MKCPHCQSFVAKIPVTWKCPRCGNKLPEPSKWYYFKEALHEYLNTKGIVFWSIWFGIFLILVGIVEILVGEGFLLKYLTGNLLFSLIFIFYGGMLIDMYMKINLPLRALAGSDYILKERQVIRNARKVTNGALLVGLIFCLYWLKPRLFFTNFPSYLVGISWFLGLAWAIIGLFLDVRMTEDSRFRLFMEKLGITSLKRMRKFATITIGLLVVAVVGYNILLTIPSLWTKISNTAIIGAVIFFVSEYLAWLV